ncbi:MAG: CoA transferase [Rhodospirillales bacterium]
MSGPETGARREAMLAAILRLLEGCRTIAVGAASPLPGAAALLARAKWGARVLILGSRRHASFTDGGRELFDLAGQGRLDAFFLSGGQIDGRADINLLGIGAYPDALTQRFPGSFGSAYLYFVVPRVILFREEHETRVLPERVDVVSAPGVSPPGVYRPGGPVALVTGRCVFVFDRARARFVLDSVHGGEDAASVRAATGFDYDAPAAPRQSAVLAPEDLALLRGRVADEIAETYPRFAAGLRAA